MAASTIHAKTGEIMGRLGWTLARQTLPTAWSNWTYTGSITGAYVGELDAVDGTAALMNGMTTSQFRGLASGVRNMMRAYVRDHLSTVLGRGSTVAYVTWRDYTTSSTYKSVSNTAQTSDKYGLPLGKFDADLIYGLIPELSAVNVSDAEKNAIKTYSAQAYKLMTSFSSEQTNEIVKACRRERAVKIDQIFREIIKWRNAGYAQTTTIKKILLG